jgi:hypothetical protein
MRARRIEERIMGGSPAESVPASRGCRSSVARLRVFLEVIERVKAFAD